MKLFKPIFIAIALLSLYPAATWVALHWYQDDPNTMNWNDREAFNRKFISQLALDGSISQQDVQAKLGGPDISEAQSRGSNLFQLAFYRTQREISDGLTTKDECTALLYVNRKLVARGSAAIDKYQQP